MRSQGGGVKFQSVTEVGAPYASYEFYNGQFLIRPPVGAPPEILLGVDQPAHPRLTGSDGQVELTRSDRTDRVVLLAKGLGDTPLNASQLTTGTLPDARLSAQVARRDVANTFVANQRVEAATPRIKVVDTSQPADQRQFQIVGLNQQLVVAVVNDAETAEAGPRPLTLTRTGDAQIGRDLYEKQRAVPLGHWVDISFAAGNFTSNAGSWTVTAGSVGAFAYTLIGQTLTLTLQINPNTVITGTPTYLSVALPAGLVAARPGIGTVVMQNSGWRLGHAIAVAGGSALVLQREDISSFVPGSDFGCYLTVTCAIA